MRATKHVVGLLCLGLWACDEGRKIQPASTQLGVPDEVQFGPVALFQSARLSAEIAHLGRAPVRIVDLQVNDSSQSFSVSRPSWMQTPLVAGQVESLEIQFAPTSAGPHEAILNVFSYATDSPILQARLIGVGVDTAVRFHPSSLNFGRIEVGAVKVVGLTLVNSSPLPSDVAFAMEGSDALDFSHVSQSALPPSSSISTEFRFHPQSSGQKDVSLVLTPCSGCQPIRVPVDAWGLERALIAEPNPVQLGSVPIDRQSQVKARLRNVSTEPIQISTASWDALSDVGFQYLEPDFPQTVAPLSVWEYAVSYTPGHTGEAAGELLFKTDSAHRPQTAVSVHAQGGAPELCIVPASVDFGELPIGALATQTLMVQNCGAVGTSSLEVTDITWLFSTEPPSFQVKPLLFPVRLQPGAQQPVVLTFEPTSEGRFEDTLKIEFQGGQFQVPVRGQAQLFRPCEIAVSPAALQFHHVPSGQGAVLGVRIANVGPDLCALKRFRIEPADGSLFSFVAEPIDSIIVPPGNAFAFQIAFDGLKDGAHQAELVFDVSNPDKPVYRMPLSAWAEPSCVEALPRFLDFRFARNDCPAPVLSSGIRNNCPTTRVLNQVTIGEGTAPFEFALKEPAVLPLSLPPGAEAQFGVQFQGRVTGMQLAPLYFHLDNSPEPLLVPLVGESLGQSNQTDVFVQPDPKKADVLWVIDNTSSMLEEQPRLINALSSFVRSAMDNQIDLHVAVTTTGIEPVSSACPGGALGGEAGRFFPVDGSSPRLLTSEMPNLLDLLRKNVSVGACATLEQGLEAMLRALSPPLISSPDDPRTAMQNDGNAEFLRPEATLAVFFVSDEDDHSPQPVAAYTSFLLALKGRVQSGRVFAIAPGAILCASAGGVGTRYQEAAAQTGGDVLSICATDYGPLLSAFSSSLFSPNRSFPLSFLPAPNAVQVDMNGVELTEGWRVDEARQRLIVDTPPAPGSTVTVRYRLACPK